MVTLTMEQVKEIVDLLDCGFRVFVHKQSGALLSVPDFDNNPYAEEDAYKKELLLLKKQFHAYQEIPRPQAHDSFEIMVGFTEQLDNKRLKERLMAALCKRKPFQGFKVVIDGSGPYRMAWFAYKEEQLKKWVLQNVAPQPCL